MRWTRLAPLVVILAGCGSSVAQTTVPQTTLPATTLLQTTLLQTTLAPATATTTAVPTTAAFICPEIVDVEMTQTSTATFTVNTTVRSRDVDGVSYADAWEVRDLDGSVLGTRVLTHPHANEQPFTRSLADVAIPTDLTSVEVAARDSVRGFCGVTLVVEVPHS